MWLLSELLNKNDPAMCPAGGGAKCVFSRQVRLGVTGKAVTAFDENRFFCLWLVCVMQLFTCMRL